MKWFSSVWLCLLFFACTNLTMEVSTPLPYYGPSEVTLNANGTRDTVHYTVPKFSFVSQDSQEVHQGMYKGKPFVVEFYFSRCKSICPAITSQLTRLQSLIRQEGLLNQVNILTHTVDPQNDTPAVMKEYARALGVDHSNWQFVTGIAEDIYYQASKGYLVPAFPSDTAQGGFFHTDQLTLVDGDLHIRGYYDGTSTTEVDSMWLDIKKLIKEKEKGK